MRKFSGSPPDPEKDITPKQRTEVITQVREYELITPLYGGGVKPTEADPVTVVRATEVRGHLRFWWRACRGGQYGGNPAAIKQAEDELWGKAHKKDDPIVPQAKVIQIIVEPLKQNENKEIEPFKIELNDRGQKQSRYDPTTEIPAYAAFPLQYSEEELRLPTPPSKRVRDNVKFRLTISFPVDQQDEVAAALWAWETFGGIGARTRRGFGVLRCTSVKENGKNLKIDLPEAGEKQTQSWIKDKLVAYVTDGSWPSVPHLKKQGLIFKVILGSDETDSWTVWGHLIERLKDFRQRRQPSKTSKNPKQPGRSEWPEPSEIRLFTDQGLPAHKTPPIPNPPIHKFPRAAFGLPIIFQFKNRDKYNPDNKEKDPRNTVLQMETSERLASPLILKPLSCMGGKYVGLALILEGTGVDEDKLILKIQKETKEQHVKASFETTDAPLVVGEDNLGKPITIDSNTNALQAFLRYL